MKPTISLPHCQDIPICPYPESNQSNPCSHFTSWKSIFFCILQSVPESTKCSLSLRFFNQISVCNFSLPIRLKCHYCPILPDFIMQIIFGGEQKSLKSSLCSLFRSPATSSFSGLYTFLSSLFSNILKLYSFLTVRDEVAHPYITTNKVIILYILIFILVDKKWQSIRHRVGANIP